MMRHEGFAIILADVAVGDDAGLGAQVTGKLAAVVVLDNDELLTLGNCRRDRFAMEWNHPFNLQMVRGDAFFVRQLLHRLANDSLGGAPTEQGDLRVVRPEQSRWLQER